MSIFDNLVAKQRMLGFRSPDEGFKLARKEFMTYLNPKGFRQYPQFPKVVRDGKTRGELKSDLRKLAMTKVTEVKPPRFMHSVARLALLGEG